MTDSVITITQESAKSFQDKKEQMLPKDIILLLLSVSGIKGATKMQKEIFLCWKNLFFEQSNDPVYFATDLGPYSTVVDDTVRVLAFKKLINYEIDNAGELYSIAELGRDYVAKRFLIAQKLFETLSLMKSRWDVITPLQLAMETISEFPEYAVTKNNHKDGNEVRSVEASNIVFGYCEVHQKSYLAGKVCQTCNKGFLDGSFLSDDKHFPPDETDHSQGMHRVALGERKVISHINKQVFG